MTAKDFMQLIIKQLRVISKESVNKFERILEQEYKYNNVRVKKHHNYDDFNINEIPGISNSNNMSLLISQSPHSHGSHPSSSTITSSSITSDQNVNIFNFDDNPDRINGDNDNDNLTLFAEGFIISDFDPNFNLFPPEITANLPAVPALDSSVVSVQSSPISIPQISPLIPMPQISTVPPPISSYNGYHASSVSVQATRYSPNNVNGHLLNRNNDQFSPHLNNNQNAMYKINTNRTQSHYHSCNCNCYQHQTPLNNSYF